MADLAGLRADAAGQDGQFAVAQASARGFTKSSLRNLRDAGEISTLRRGVARFIGIPGEPDPAVTAFLVCWPHGVISEVSAALYHAIARGASPVPAHITVLRGSMSPPADVVLHETRFLPGCDVLKVGPLRYTTIARTVCDMAEADDLWETLSRVDDAIAKGANRGWIHSRASTLANGRSGVAAVAAATAPEASDEFRSWLERAASHIYRAADIPDPEWNVPVSCNGQLLGIPDALWRWYDVTSEMEGLRFHTTPLQRRDDAKRFNRFLDAGFSPRRFTWRDLTDTPVEVAQTILRALNSRGANLDVACVPRHIVLPERPWIPR